MSKIKLSADLSLPLDAITQTFLVVGKRGSGKSNTAARMVEQFAKAGLPFVVLDPVDTWWGLKSSRDGREKGLDVYVFGGRKADLPLEPNGGALIAEVLCEHKISMVLSVKHLSGRARSKFMVDFAQILFQKWGGGPLHVVLEEAHELAPQMSGGRGQGSEDNEAAMLGAFKRLWKLGRASGIGGTAVTQRPASLSKDITTQSEILIAHRTIGPQDVKAIGEWVKYHGEHDQILGELPTLPTGRAMVWAPEFPSDKPLGLIQTNVLLRDTYDSASTPKVGENRTEPKVLASVDLDKLRTKMAATIEKAKADDPKELKRLLASKDKRIGELERESNGHRNAKDRFKQAAADRAGKPTPVLTDADREVLKALSTDFRTFSDDIAGKADVALSGLAECAKAAIDDALGRWTVEVDKRRALFADRIERPRLLKVLEKLEQVSAPPAPIRPPVRMPAQHLVSDRSPRPIITPSRNHGTRESQGTGPRAGGAGQLGKCERALLRVLAQRAGDTTSKAQLSVLSGYSITSSSFTNALGRLRSLGLVAGLDITDAGRAEAGTVDALPSGRELVAHWAGQLGKAERTLLEAIVDVGPLGIERDGLSEVTGYSTTSSSFTNAVGKLRTLELVSKGWPVKAAAELFS